MSWLANAMLNMFAPVPSTPPTSRDTIGHSRKQCCLQDTVHPRVGGSSSSCIVGRAGIGLPKSLNPWRSRRSLGVGACLKLDDNRTYQ